MWVWLWLFTVLRCGNFALRLQYHGNVNSVNSCQDVVRALPALFAEEFLEIFHIWQNLS